MKQGFSEIKHGNKYFLLLLTRPITVQPGKLQKAAIWPPLLLQTFLSCCFLPQAPGLAHPPGADPRRSPSPEALHLGGGGSALTAGQCWSLCQMSTGTELGGTGRYWEAPGVTICLAVPPPPPRFLFPLSSDPGARSAPAGPSPRMRGGGEAAGRHDGRAAGRGRRPGRRRSGERGAAAPGRGEGTGGERPPGRPRPGPARLAGKPRPGLGAGLAAVCF